MSKLTAESAAGMIKMGPTAREEYLRNAAEGRGWKMLAFYLMDGGKFDATTIVEVPDDQAAMPGFDAANALATSASGIPVDLRSTGSIGQRMFKRHLSISARRLPGPAPECLQPRTPR